MDARYMNVHFGGYFLHNILSLETPQVDVSTINLSIPSHQPHYKYYLTA